MNNQIFGAVFKKTLGRCLVVSETVRAVLIAYLMASSPVQAQVRADQIAPANQRATVLAAPNGVTQVNIQTPSASGVSMNAYSQFDVNQKGVILNNSRTDVQSVQGGGAIGGNPWLANGSAQIIVNQVNSNQPSQINGYVEVAGQRAQVVIANPSGINIDGGGTINASRVTLTTGTPVINNGNLESYRVRDGAINITGQGLDTSNADYTAVIARAVQLNAGVWANQARITTGVNDVQHETGAATPTAAGTPAPSVALDVSQLGGMYANQIYLVGTEAGVGVRNSGTLSAGGGDLVLSNNGWLTNTGTMQASGNVQAVATGDINHSGKIYAQGSTSVASGANLNHTGVIAAAGDTVLSAGNINATSSSLTAAGVTANGTMTQVGNLTLNAAGAVAVNGQSAAGGDTTMVGASLDLSGGTHSARNMTLTASSGDIHATGANIAVSQTLSVATPQTFRTDSAQLRVNQLGVTAQHLSNVAGSIEQTGADPMSISVSGVLDNTSGSLISNAQITTIRASAVVNNWGTIATNGDLLLTTALIDNRVGTIKTLGNAYLLASSFLDNTNGTIASGAGLYLNAGTVNNNAGRITSTRGLDVYVDWQLSNVQGLLATQGPLSINSGVIDNTAGTIASTTGAGSISAAGLLINDSGAIQTAQDLVLSTVGVSNTKATGSSAGGLIATGGNLLLDTGLEGLNNSAGTIASGATLTLNTGALNNNAGLIQSVGASFINTNQQTLNNQNAAGYGTNGGGITSQDTLTIQTAGLNNTQGLIAARGKIDVASTDLNNTSGQVMGQAGIKLVAGSVTNTNGMVQALGDIQIDAGAGLSAGLGTGLLDNTSGLLRSGTALSINALNIINNNTSVANNQLGIQGTQVTLTSPNLFNVSGNIIGNTNVRTTGSGLLDNTTGLISAGQALTLTDATVSPTLTIINAGGTLLAGSSLALNAASLSGDGSVLSRGDMALSLSTDLTNTGRLIANHHLMLISNAGVINSGSLQAGNTLTVNVQNLENQVSGVISGTSTVLTVANTLTNRGVIDGATTWLTANTINNIGTGRIYGDQLSIQAVELNNKTENNRAATIAARVRMDLGVGTLVNEIGGLIFSVGDLFVGGSLDSNGRAIGSAGSITNDSAMIQAMGNLVINAAQILNRNSTFAATTSQQSLFRAPNTDYFDYAQPIAATNNRPYSEGLFFDINGPSGEKYGPENISWATTFNKDRGWSTNYVMVPIDHQYANIQYQAVYASTVWNDTVDSTSGGDGSSRTFIQGSTKILPTDPIWGLLKLKPPSYALPVAPNDDGSGEYAALYSEWLKLSQPWKDLQVAVNAMTSNINATGVVSNLVYLYSQSTPTVVVTRSDPGQIAAGGAMTLNASQTLKNDKSQILAGGSLNVTGQSIQNIAAEVTGQVIKEGVSYLGIGRRTEENTAFNEVTQVTITAPVAKVLSNQAVSASYTINGMTLGSVTSTPGASSLSNVTVGTTSVPAVQRIAMSNPTGIAQQVRSVNRPIILPTASLYNLNPSVSSHYLIETDPQFIQTRPWVSSDYLLNALRINPASSQKLIGDGFYQQQLVQQQVADLTGQLYLGGNTNTQDEYVALMDNGAAAAQLLDLQLGTELTPEQVARLSSSIVWLVSQTVTLPDGSSQQVLVPKVYALTTNDGIDGSGTLMAGRNLNITAQGDLTNTGTLAAADVASLAAQNLQNLGGRITGNSVWINTTNDLNNIGGQIDALTSMSLFAGRDLNSTSTTVQGFGQAEYSTSKSIILDRIATISVSGPGGLLDLVAGRDINLTASSVSASGANSSIHADAGQNFNLATVITGESHAMSSNEDINVSTSSWGDVGSMINSQGNVLITAGQNVQFKAANLQAAGDVELSAKGNVVFDAGQTVTTLDSSITIASSGLFGRSTSTQVQASSATAEVTTIQGKSISVVADQNLVSIGTKFYGLDSVYVEGKATSAFYAATDTEQRESTITKSSSMFGLKLSNIEINDSKQQSTSIGTSLISNQKIEFGVGDKTVLQGANVSAPQISFALTDLNKAGELILGGRTDSIQVSHTEKAGYAGLWQASKGDGSTTQTLNQTLLNGNVTFDAALKIVAQISDRDGSAQYKSRIQALAAQTPGLEYLNQLLSDPDVQWDKVALAIDNWSYRQEGLTPAGAILLSILMSAVAPGLSAGLMSAITSTFGASVAAALNAGFITLQAQTAVAFVNSGGDIGKTFQQLGSSNNIKGLLTAMVTAGALNRFDSAMGWNDSSQTVTGQSGSGTIDTNGIATSQIPNQFQQNFAKNIVNNVTGSVIDAAINGKSLDEKSLVSALSNALITSGIAQGANSIGDAKGNGDINVFTQAVAHAALGCLGGVASVGKGAGCTPGALGGLIGEMSANYALLNGASRDDAIAFARVISAVAGVIAGGGGDNIEAINLAATMGANAAANNRTLHESETQILASLKQGKTQEQADRLDAAACALIHCAEGVPLDDPRKARLQAIQIAGASFMLEQSQLVATGQFGYGRVDSAWDWTTSTGVPIGLNSLKIAGGALSVATGSALCVSVVGCGLGGGMGIFGVNEMTEGVSGLYNQYQGNSTAGINPIKMSMNQLTPKFGDLVYDSFNLTFSLFGLRVNVPLKVGFSDGIDRVNSLFGVTVPRINNPIINPFNKTVIFAPPSSNVLNLLGASKKATTVLKDISEIRGEE